MDDVKLAEALSDHKHRIGSLEHCMEKAENLIEEIRNLSGSVQLLAQESKSTGEKVDNLTEKVECLESAPGKKWGTLQTVAITAITSGVITAILSAIIGLM